MCDVDVHDDRVYPRVGGETIIGATANIHSEGLSPRGRGNPDRGSPAAHVLGSIPAWAGKPSSLPIPLIRLRVYPRVGGETRDDPQDGHRADGLSPRGRGNRLRNRAGAEVAGSIPAWAGKPQRQLGFGLRQQVYPRVGGETSRSVDGPESLEGLSPRGRGNPTSSLMIWASVGSIPAWAGKPSLSTRLVSRCRVYPRVGGETRPASGFWT